jgi:hypothetical protein
MTNIDIIPCAINNKNKQIIDNPITCQFESRKMFGKIFSTVLGLNRTSITTYSSHNNISTLKSAF